mmetsp:Transcript_76185/g.192638  ORF Transcript_76185/g.192638 Transcript_76185/m.192638 type:complete len:224 (-) Transcript_76185:2873-3544(-)
MPLGIWRRGPVAAAADLAPQRHLLRIVAAARAAIVAWAAAASAAAMAAAARRRGRILPGTATKFQWRQILLGRQRRRCLCSPRWLLQPLLVAAARRGGSPRGLFLQASTRIAPTSHSMWPRCRRAWCARTHGSASRTGACSTSWTACSRSSRGTVGPCRQSLARRSSRGTQQQPHHWASCRSSRGGTVSSSLTTNGYARGSAPPPSSSPSAGRRRPRRGRGPR